jgi:hypothetical protein
MSKVIWHVGAWANNVGDRVLQKSTEDMIRERCNEEVCFVHINCQQTYFFPDLIEKMNREADMLLIGGGGLIFHRPMDRSHSGWQFNIDKDNIKNINK